MLDSESLSVHRPFKGRLVSLYVRMFCSCPLRVFRTRIIRNLGRTIVLCSVSQCISSICVLGAIIPLPVHLYLG